MVTRADCVTLHQYQKVDVQRSLLAQCTARTLCMLDCMIEPGSLVEAASMFGIMVYHTPTAAAEVLLLHEYALMFDV